MENFESGLLIDIENIYTEPGLKTIRDLVHLALFSDSNITRRRIITRLQNGARRLGLKLKSGFVADYSLFLGLDKADGTRVTWYVGDLDRVQYTDDNGYFAGGVYQFYLLS